VTVKLSIVDQSPIREGGTAREALAETVELAQLADRLGYHRYWVAEHHNTLSFAGSAPEIMVAKLASETKRIRVGSGGVMMTHYAPLKVAETFRVLHMLAPDRIDLGIGRAPGSDLRTMAALQPGPERYGPQVYPQQIQLVKDLLADASGEAPLGENHPFHGIHARPEGPGSPEVWILGSGPDSAEVAAVTGHPFSYAHFIVGDGGSDGIGGVETLMHYRRRFVPSTACPAPHAMIGVAAIVAETDEEAEHLSSSVRLWAARVARGNHAPFPSPETALSHEYSEAEKAAIASREQRVFLGTPSKVRDQLMAKAEDYGAQEIAVVTITYDHAARMRSYELLAQAFGL
jgi:luciferase family oxidoreductase group 1